MGRFCPLLVGRAKLVDSWTVCAHQKKEAGKALPFAILFVEVNTSWRQKEKYEKIKKINGTCIALELCNLYFPTWLLHSSITVWANILPFFLSFLSCRPTHCRNQVQNMHFSEKIHEKRSFHTCALIFFCRRFGLICGTLLRDKPKLKGQQNSISAPVWEECLFEKQYRNPLVIFSSAFYSRISIFQQCLLSTLCSSLIDFFTKIYCKLFTVFMILSCLILSSVFILPFSTKKITCDFWWMVCIPPTSQLFGVTLLDLGAFPEKKFWPKSNVYAHKLHIL